MTSLLVPVEWIIIGVTVLVILIVITLVVIPRLLPVIAVILAVINDLVDLGLIGTLPVTGDLLDLITSIAIALGFRDWKAALSLLELIPGIDFLPIHTLTIILILGLRRRKEKIEKSLTEVEEKYWTISEIQERFKKYL